MPEPHEWPIIITGAFVAGSCALLGVFLVLRKMAMLGDAISHAVLPGIAIAFLMSGSRDYLPMLLGAGSLGVLTVFLVGLLNRTRRMKEDASIGVVFPALFSVGVILMSRYAAQIDLDQDCVWNGEIAFTYLNPPLVVAGQSLGPASVWVCAMIFCVNLLLVVVFYKELKITSFDPDLAVALGLSPVLMHYLLMSAVSVTVVSSFESVGAILVVAMLIVPAATAYLFTHRLWSMLALSVLFGVLSSTLGYVIAVQIDCSVAGAMAAVAGIFFVVSFLLSPRQGLVPQALIRGSLAREFRGQLILFHLSAGGEGTSTHDLRERFRWSRRRLLTAVSALEAKGFVHRSEDALRLTDRGARAIEEADASALVHR